jgi:hypothetical protein
MKTLTKPQQETIHNLYFKEHFTFGRDKIYQYLRSQYPSLKISRRQVMNWLNKQELSQIFKNIQPTKDIKSVIVSGPYKQIAMDLKDMQNDSYEDYNYILTMKDLFSKKVWAKAIKDKEGATVLNAFKELLKEMKAKPKSIRSDNGSEFVYTPFQNYLKKENITQVFSSPGNPQSNGGIERFNGTLKKLINMYRTQTDETDWVHILPKLLDNYNNSVNRVTGKTPNELDNLNLEDKKEIEDKIKKETTPKNNDTQNDELLPLNTQVRLKVMRDKLQKSNNQNWTQELFRIYKRFKAKEGRPVYYYVKKDGHKYTDKLYKEDLQVITNIETKVKKTQKGYYDVSQIVKPVMKKNGKIFVESFEIQWKGYSKKDNTIEPRDWLMADIPKMIHQYEKKHDVVWNAKSVKYTK